MTVLCDRHGGAARDLALPRDEALLREIATWRGDNSTLIVLDGPVGTGKARLARSLAAGLPAPSGQDLVDLGWIYEGAGLGEPPAQAPFRAPHHTVSSAGLLGGGATRLRPGEVSLAHAGCLLLDDLTEFRRSVVEALGEELDAGVARFYRDRLVALPARPRLVVATVAPCPCGGARECHCSAGTVARHRERVRAFAQSLAWACSHVVWATVSVEKK